MFHPFRVEQFLSEMEHGVAYNFSESGVHPMTLGELMELTGMEMKTLTDTLLDYPQVNGFTLLRERIADLYPGADAENIMVTTGATEANTLVASTLLEEGDSAVVFRPCYEQFSGNVLNRGIDVRFVQMDPERAWKIDADAVAAAVDDTTKVIHVINPHNPTGQILDEEERRIIIEAAERSGAWVVSDEVYIGTERNSNAPTKSFWGDYDKVMVLNSMSKAYGLPGLRLGWLVGPKPEIVEAWRRHEYASVAASMLSMKLAEAVMAEPARSALAARARRLIRVGFETLSEALKEHPGVFSVTAPEASAMSFVRFDLPVDSDVFAGRLHAEKDVLVIPGSKFAMSNHFRFSSALPDDYLKEGLRRLNELVGEILSEAR